MVTMTHFLDGSLEAVAPAKINLFLHVTGRRDDGYHLLDSLFAFTNRGDTVRVAEGAGVSVSITGPFAGALNTGLVETNLVWQAANKLKRHTGCDKGVHISLRKNLPVASGIGGGSADAAASLLALNEFWQLGLELKDMLDIALELGADVPACLSRSPVRVKGIGEHVAPAELPKGYGIVLVNPRVPLSTPAVFKVFKDSGRLFGKPVVKALPKTDAEFVHFLANETQNTLREPATELARECASVLDSLARLDAALYTQMSGSGATCYALFDGYKEAQAAARVLQSQQPNWWIMADSLVCR